MEKAPIFEESERVGVVIQKMAVRLVGKNYLLSEKVGLLDEEIYFCTVVRWVNP